MVVDLGSNIRTSTHPHCNFYVHIPGPRKLGDYETLTAKLKKGARQTMKPNTMTIVHTWPTGSRGDNLPGRPRVFHQLTGSKVLRLLRWRRRSASRQVVAPPSSSLSGFGERACLRLYSVRAPLYSAAPILGYQAPSKCSLGAVGLLLNRALF